MKDKIIEILKNNEVTVTDEYGGSEKAVLSDYYTDVAEEIVKLLATPAVSKKEGSGLCVSVAVMDALQSRLATIQGETDTLTRETMIDLLLVDITVC